MSETPFIVTVDTEGDNLWARPREITTKNAEYLPRFQALCERFKLRPVYLTNYEMAISEAFCEFGRDVLARGTGEIGMHLHAWNSPPLDALTDDDFGRHPYLTEYAEPTMRRKIAFMTRLLEQCFDRHIVSHRAGRWGFDGRYAMLLAEQGYLVDCSVTPGIDWRANAGARAGSGPDYRECPRAPYSLDPANIARPAESGLLEVPMTVRPSSVYAVAAWLYDVPLLRRAANHVSPGLPWLCPIQPGLRTSLPRHLAVMLSVARAAHAARDVEHLQFMIHSSELMPGGSPDFRSATDIELLYEHLEVLFREVTAWCRGVTLAELAMERAVSSAPARRHPAEGADTAAVSVGSAAIAAKACAPRPPA